MHFYYMDIDNKTEFLLFQKHGIYTERTLTLNGFLHNNHPLSNRHPNAGSSQIFQPILQGHVAPCLKALS